MAKRILMVDDDPDFVEACKNFLEAANYTVEYEDSEERVVDKARKIRPDIILLDVVMSRETSGFEIVQALSEDAELSSIPVVFLTGYFQKDAVAEKEAEIRDRWKNVRHVLEKPVKPSHLLQVLKGL